VCVCNQVYFDMVVTFLAKASQIKCIESFIRNK
jgi:hypothetical protein